MSQEQIRKMHQSINNIKSKLSSYHRNEEATFKKLPEEDIIPSSLKNDHNDHETYRKVQNSERKTKKSLKDFDYVPPRHHLDGSEMYRYFLTKGKRFYGIIMNALKNQNHIKKKGKKVFIK